MMEKPNIWNRVSLVFSQSELSIEKSQKKLQKPQRKRTNLGHQKQF